MADWYYAKDGATIGPFSEEVFLKMLAEGSVNRATKVWREGFPEWTTLGATDLVPKTNASLPPPSTYFEPNRQYGSQSEFGRRVLKPFNDLSGLTSGLVTCFYIAAGLAAIAMVSDAFQYKLIMSINPDAVDREALKSLLDSNDSRQGLINIAQLLLSAGIGIGFLTWINQANKNVRSLGAENLRFTPDWAVGWWFVPVLFLVRPLQIMTEIWKASHNPQSWESERSDSRIGWWWLFFVCMYVFNVGSYRVIEFSQALSGIAFGTVLSILANMAAAGSALMGAKIIGEIWTAQRSSRYGRGAGITPMAVARK